MGVYVQTDYARQIDSTAFFILYLKFILYF